MPVDELIRAAEQYKAEEQKTENKKTSNPNNPPKKTHFDSRQLER